MKQPPFITTFWLLLCLVVTPSAQREASDAEREHFEFEIRPLFSAACVHCHGGTKAESGLRLDSVEGIVLGGDRGSLFDRERPERGLLFGALTYEDPLLAMPPDGKLFDFEWEVLRDWIANGAPMPGVDKAAKAAAEVRAFDLEERSQHWAYQPLDPPRVDWDRPADPIDRWVSRRICRADLTPAPQADRRTLLRRVTIDLVGLPPTPEETRAFLADKSPGAFARVVDRLLGSVHFGERWGRHWLDLMRYAETRGHEFDYVHPNAWQYRDYVIRALNQDVPFDDFLREHLAGDLLAEPRRNPESGFDESILGTGFWFLGDEVHSPVDIRADETDRIAGQIDALTKGFLGLTVACARCHDHKFDAITTADYYALSGFAMSGAYRPVRFDTHEHNARVAAELNAEYERIRRPVSYAARLSLATRIDSVGDVLVEALAGGDQQAELVRAAEDPEHPLHVLGLVRDVTDSRLLRASLVGLSSERQVADAGEVRVVESFGSDHELLQNGVAFQFRRRGEPLIERDAPALVREFAPRDAVYFDRAWDVLESAPGSERAPGKVHWEQAGRTLRTKTFVLEEPRLFYLVRGGGHAYVSIDTHRMVEGPLHAAAVKTWDAGRGFRWIEQDLRDYVGHRVHVEFSPREDDSRFALATVAQGTRRPRVATDHLGLEELLREGAPTVRHLAESIARRFRYAINTLSRGAADEASIELLNYLMAHPELSRAPEELELESTAAAFHGRRLTEILDRIRPVSRIAAAMFEGSGVDEHVLLRGSHQSPGPLVERRFLEVFAGRAPIASTPGSHRRELAEAFVDNPLFARVAVNRVWHHLFGRGIVRSVDDFGVMGDEPTHPRVLEHLASWFVEDGYSIKELVRRIVLTDAYQRSGARDPRAANVDPDNLWLSYRAPRRLDAEALRDALLVASGRLERTPYGAPVPIHLTEFLEGRGRPAGGPLDGAGRRSVYLAVRRNFPLPLFAVFDFPSPAAPVGRRSVSNVPSQSLTLMNDPFVWNQAEVTAYVLTSAIVTTQKRLEMLYERVLTRKPTSEEAEALTAFVETEGRERDEFEVWRDVSHVLFNTKEFLFVR